MNALAKGIALFLVLGTWVTSQSTGPDDDSVHLHVITQMMKTVRKIEPYSCWCASSVETGVICPVKITNLTIDKDLDIFCGSQKMHCCLEQVVKQEEALPDLKPVDILKKRNELSDLLSRFTRYLMPHNALSRHNISDVYSSILQNNFEKSIENNNSHGIIFNPDNTISDVYDTQNTDKENNHGENFLKDTKNSIYDYLGSLIQDLGNFFLTPAHHHNKRSARNKTIEEKAAALIIGFINSTFFQNNKVKTTEQTNSTEPDLEKIDTDLEKINDPYARLGWFSRAVETAIDGSVYVGSAIGMMYVVSMFLSGLVNSVWTTCFMCYFVENFELVPIAT